MPGEEVFPSTQSSSSTSACHTGSQNMTREAVMMFLIKTNITVRRGESRDQYNLQATRTVLQLHEEDTIGI